MLQYNIGCICVNSLCYCLCSRIYDNIYMIRNSQCWYFLSNIISVICLYFCQYKWVPTACYQPLIIFDELKVCIQKGILVLFSLEFYCQSASTIIPKPFLDWKPGQQESIYACYFLIFNPGWTQNFSKYYSESIIKEW